MQRRSSHDTNVCSKAGRPPTVIETSKNPAQQSEVDSNTAATVIDTSDFFLFNLLLMNQFVKQGGTKDKRKLRKVNRQKAKNVNKNQASYLHSS